MIDYDNHIMYALQINGDGTAAQLEEQAISEAIQSDQLAWVHLDAENPASREWLEKEVDYLDPIIINALLAEETRPRILEFDKGMMLILRGMNLNENAEPEDMVSIRLWIDENRIISVRRRKLRAIQDIREKLLAGKGPKNSGDFLAMLTSRLFERMEPVLTDLDQNLDDLEEKVMETPDKNERRAITDMRRQTIIFRRYIVPQRDVMMALRTTDKSWISPLNKRHLQESYDRIIRYIEDLDTMRERAQIIKDELTSALSDAMNKNLYMLSLVAAIFLPLGFLTGLLGINVGGIPGADNPQSFAIFCAILTVLVGIQLWIFKKLKWL